MMFLVACSSPVNRTLRELQYRSHPAVPARDLALCQANVNVSTGMAMPVEAAGSVFMLLPNVTTAAECSAACCSGGL